MGPGTGAEGAVVPPTLAKFNISPMAFHGKKSAEIVLASCPAIFANGPEPLHFVVLF